jgi:hypothetical protein
LESWLPPAGDRAQSCMTCQFKWRAWQVPAPVYMFVCMFMYMWCVHGGQACVAGFRPAPCAVHTDMNWALKLARSRHKQEPWHGSQYCVASCRSCGSTRVGEWILLTGGRSGSLASCSPGAEDCFGRPVVPRAIWPNDKQPALCGSCCWCRRVHGQFHQQHRSFAAAIDANRVGAPALKKLPANIAIPANNSIASLVIYVARSCLPAATVSRM